MNLLIADRDQTERTGIKWLATTSRLGFTRIDEAEDVETLIQTIEQKTPDVLCVELEMIPPSHWELFIRCVNRYVRATIAVTAEAVFERAMQAIQLGARTLLVKPLSPEQLRRAFVRASNTCAYKKTEAKELSRDQSEKDTFTHTSLFVHQPTANPVHLMYFLPEKKENKDGLIRWLNRYPFVHEAALLPLSDGVVALYSRIAGDPEAYLRSEGQRLLQAWEGEGRGLLTIGIHLGTKHRAQSVHHAYQVTKRALSMRFYRGQHQLLWAHELPEYLQLDPFLTPEEQREWKQMLENGDKSAIKRWMYRHFTDFPSGYLDPDLLRIRLTSVLAHLRRFMQTYHLDRQARLEPYYHDIFQTILYEPVLFRIVQEILLFTFALVDAAENQKRQALGDFIERGQQYIEQHFAKPTLSLEEVAAFVGRNPNYFSQTFAKQKGQTFRQYLTEVRIQKAKQLLREGTLSVQEVADAVGYTDPNYFSRVFKALTGASPNAWRNMEKHKES